MTVASVVIVLEAWARVRALTGAGRAVVNHILIGAGGVDTHIGCSAQSHGGRGADTITARIVVVGALRGD